MLSTAGYFVVVTGRGMFRLWVKLFFPLLHRQRKTEKAFGALVWVVTGAAMTIAAQKPQIFFRGVFMYHPFMRLCGDPSRVKYVLCVFLHNGFGAPFIRTYQSYARYNKALAYYLSRPDCVAVSYVKYRGKWVYSSISHTCVSASPFVLEAARKTAASLVESYLE